MFFSTWHRSTESVSEALLAIAAAVDGDRMQRELAIRMVRALCRGWRGQPDTGAATVRRQVTALVERFDASDSADRGALLTEIHRQLGVLVAESISVAEAAAVDEALAGAIVGSVPGDEWAEMLRWWLPALDEPERLRLLQGFGAIASPASFAAVVMALRAQLSNDDWQRLSSGLAGVAPTNS